MGVKQERLRVFLTCVLGHCWSRTMASSTLFLTLMEHTPLTHQPPTSMPGRQDPNESYILCLETEEFGACRKKKGPKCLFRFLKSTSRHTGAVSIPLSQARPKLGAGSTSWSLTSDIVYYKK